MGSDHIRVIPTSCSELIGICSEKFRAISKIGSDFTDAAFRADMRVSEWNRSEPLGNASFRSETVGESKDLCWSRHSIRILSTRLRLFFVSVKTRRLRSPGKRNNSQKYFYDLFHQRPSLHPIERVEGDGN